MIVVVVLFNARGEGGSLDGVQPVNLSMGMGACLATRLF